MHLADFLTQNGFVGARIIGVRKVKQFAHIYLKNKKGEAQTVIAGVGIGRVGDKGWWKGVSGIFRIKKKKRR